MVRRDVDDPVLVLGSAGVRDLRKFEEPALEFYASSRFLKVFDIDKFETFWRAILEADIGVIFTLRDQDHLAGALGGVIYPDMYSGVPVATEFFWFVRSQYRGLKGLRLYDMFESWARERGCGQIRMVHLEDLMPDKLRRVYGRMGFRAAETHYIKEL